MDVLICFSHLRWNFVYQRPQHILSRLSALYPVFFIEEPVYGESVEAPFNKITKTSDNIHIVVPHLGCGLAEEEVTAIQKKLLDSLILNFRLNSYIVWYYSPLALLYSRHLSPLLTVYDCMDELSAFLYAPPMLRQCEAELIDRADLLLTGGYSLYNVKKALHRNTYCFPSSIDKAHFSQARQLWKDPADQESIPHPRLGFFGVLDERFNTALVAEVANLRKDWHFILIGPVVKIDPASLPRAGNIHYPGMKPYSELPAYLAGWDIAIMPFALNEATAFISPTKTPEYLAGGKPVISTSIKDVIHMYGNKQMVRIADTAQEFIAAAEFFLHNGDMEAALGEIDDLLEEMSWDGTVQAITALMRQALSEKASMKKQS